MLRSFVVLLLVSATALAQPSPPSGYRCGPGKPSPGTGCHCPAKTVEQRTAKNYAICAPLRDTSATANAPAPPCKQAAARIRGLLAKSAQDLPEDIPAAKRGALFGALATMVQRRCITDRWTIEQATCFARATTGPAMEACADKLSPAQANVLEKSADALMEQFAKQAAKPVTVTTKPSIQILERVYFPVRGSAIAPASQPVLDAVAAQLKAHPTMRLRVAGHTDNREESAANHLRLLSFRRASAVAAYLVKAGIAGARLETKGYGADKPIAANVTEENRAKNRRVEFHVVAP